MGLSKIKEAAENILNRIDSVKGRGEQATKQAMVLPMLDALGYDIWNPNEVCPEFEADTAVKKSGQKEKVDYAIILRDQPRIFIEVKDSSEDLDGHQGQLKRYFMSTPSVSLGVLTNGLEYRFFTDTGEPNIQDDRPFHVAILDAVDQGLEVMARFQKEVFSPNSIREFATELTYTAKFIEYLNRELDIQDGELSDGFVGWILRSPDMYEGRITANVVERFRPIAKTALQRVVSKIVRRIVADIDAGVSSASVGDIAEEAAQDEQTTCAPNIQLPEKEDVETQAQRKDIVTTESELECFAITKRLFENSALSAKTIFDPGTRQNVPIEINYKDTTAYFNIYFNKPSWWNMRICLAGKTKWVGFDVDPDLANSLLPDSFELLPSAAVAEYRVRVRNPQDLLTLTDLVHASFEKTIKDREVLRDK